MSLWDPSSTVTRLLGLTSHLDHLAVHGTCREVPSLARGSVVGMTAHVLSHLTSRTTCNIGPIQERGNGRNRFCSLESGFFAFALPLGFGCGVVDELVAELGLQSRYCGGTGLFG